MRTAHKHLKLTDKEFNATAEILEQTMVDLKIDSSIIKEILNLVETLRKPNLD